MVGAVNAPLTIEGLMNEGCRGASDVKFQA
jgi:hypothetical protein